MVALLLIGLVLIGLTVRLLVYAVVLPRIKLAAHLREIDAYGFEAMPAGDSMPVRKSAAAAMATLAQKLGQALMAQFPAIPSLAQRDLSAAAIYDVSPETVHGFRLMAAVGLPISILLCGSAFGGVTTMAFFMAVIAAVGGWALPAVAIQARGQRRLHEIDRDLPDLIDLLTATMEAGMGFAASLDLVAGRFKGALGEELRLTQQQQKLGVTNEQALKDMVERCDTGSMRSFVRTLRTAESLGVSIGPSMRELAHDVRRRRRQAADERMRKAPVKLLFPLIFLIFPALLIEVMFPAAYTLIHQLSHH